MRDTYADTSLARADLGFAPRGVARTRSRSGVSMAFDNVRAGLMAARRPPSARVSCRWRCWSRWRLLERGRRSRPPARPEPDKFLFDRGTEELNDQTLADRARVLPAAGRQLSAEPVTAPTPSSASATPTSARSRRSRIVLATNEFREFLTFYPTHTRADYAQYKLGMTFFYQMHGPERDQTETREAIKELTVFVERYPQQPADRRGARPGCARRAIVSASPSTGSATSTGARVVSGRDRPLQGDPRQRSAVLES